MVRDPLGPDGEPSLPTVGQVPDDPRDLARDARALARERRGTARRARASRLLLSRRGDLVGPSPLLALVVLAAVALLATLPVLLRPQLGVGPQDGEPLAAPAQRPGEVGGLLPDVTLQTPAGEAGTRGLTRPGVLVLVPVPCADCAQTLGPAIDRLLQGARAVRLVSTGAQDPGGGGVAALGRGPGRGLVTTAVDPEAALARAYAARGVTAVLYGPDGRVVDVVRDGGPLDLAIARLVAAR